MTRRSQIQQKEMAMAMVAVEAETCPPAEPERDPWFNPYRFPGSKGAWEVVHAVLDDLAAQESRKRARRTKDQHWLWEVLPALVTDLIYHHLSGGPGSGLVVRRAKRELGKTSRYYPPLFTRSFPGLLDALENLGYLQQQKGVYSGMPGQSRRTTIRAGSGLIALIEKQGVTFSDLALSDAEEVIILKRARTDHWDEGERVEYGDTSAARHFREEVRAINAWLEKADISFNPAAHSSPVDVRARRLYRYFANDDFKSGGRLFRGFWENLPKDVRLEGITIEGERVVELDYAQLNPTLAYAKVSCLPPVGDAYALPGLEQYRDGVKKVFNSLLFDKGPRRSFPKGVNVLFPPKTKIREVIGGIHEKHPMLASVLSTGVGFHLMFLESEIMMRVLEQLRVQNIVGLPMFDAVIVKASEEETAKAVMKKEFKKATGLEIVVRLERSLGASVHAGPLSVSVVIYRTLRRLTSLVREKGKGGEPDL